MLYSHKRYDISTYVFIYIYIFMIYILGLTIEHISLTHLYPIYSHLPFLIIMLTYQRIWSERAPEFCLPCYNFGLEGPIHTEAHN